MKFVLRVGLFSTSTIVRAFAIGTDLSLSECRINSGFDVLVTCLVGEACVRASVGSTPGGVHKAPQSRATRS